MAYVTDATLSASDMSPRRSSSTANIRGLPARTLCAQAVSQGPRRRMRIVRVVWARFDIYVERFCSVSRCARSSFLTLPQLTCVARRATHPIMPGLENYDARMALAALRPRSRPTKVRRCFADRARGLRRSRHMCGRCAGARRDHRDREGRAQQRSYTVS